MAGAAGTKNGGCGRAWPGVFPGGASLPGSGLASAAGSAALCDQPKLCAAAFLLGPGPSAHARVSLNAFGSFSTGGSTVAAVFSVVFILRQEFAIKRQRAARPQLKRSAGV